MPGRNWVSDAYRYGHNGQEKEDEIAKGINSAEYWMYDSRLGRRWETDPIVKPWESPYATFGNNPIAMFDPLGLDGEKPNQAGHKYDCGDGSYEVFNGNEYVPSKSIAEEVIVKAYILPLSSIPTSNVQTQNKIQSIEKSITAKGTQNIFINWLKRMDHIADHSSDNYTNRKPIMTNFGGYEQVGAGGNRNIHFVSPYIDDYDDKQIPGTNVAGAGGSNYSYTKGDPFGPLVQQAEQFFKASSTFNQAQDFNDKVLNSGGGSTQLQNSKSLTSQQNDSVESYYQINGKRILVREPRSPINNQNKNGIILEGPNRGKSHNVFFQH